jgi:hypothetical protein
MKRRFAVALLVAALLIGGRELAAQRADGFALPPDHRAVEAVRRLQTLGFLPGSLDLGRRGYTVREIGALLREAGEKGGPASAAAGILASFEAEFPAVDSTSWRPWVELFVEGSFASDSHDPGFFVRRQWTEAPVRPAGHGSQVGTDAWLRIGSRTVAAVGGVLADTGGPRLRSAYLHHDAGPWSLWAGRRSMALGMRGPHTQILAEVPIDGIGIRRGGPVRPPGVLRFLGPITGEAFFGRPHGDSGDYADPLFWGARFTLSPHRAVTLGFNRVTLFGGDGNEPITPKNVLLMIAGYSSFYGKNTSFENSLASADVAVLTRFAGTPLVLSGEWAFEDASFAFAHVPGLSGRAELPSLPGAPRWSAALSHTWMDRSCCGYPSWYHHMDFGAGWVLDRQPLGHPLGGHGRETRIELERDPLLHRVGVGISGARRFRGHQNIYAPSWKGGSWALGVELGVRASRRSRLGVEARLEAGDAGWRTHRTDVFATFRP